MNRTLKIMMQLCYFRIFFLIIFHQEFHFYDKFFSISCHSVCKYRWWFLKHFLINISNRHHSVCSSLSWPFEIEKCSFLILIEQWALNCVWIAIIDLLLLLQRTHPKTTSTGMCFYTLNGLWNNYWVYTICI